MNAEQTVRWEMQAYHGIDAPSEYLLFVEGAGDIDFLNATADKVKKAYNFDLLAIDGEQRSEGEITICSPKNMQIPCQARGGVGELVRLAETIKPHVLRYNVPSPVCFLLDHDEAGKTARQKIVELGLNADTYRPITLDPDEHVSARPSKRGELVIEDLIQFDVHKQFFDDAPRDCTVRFLGGKSSHISWEGDSKVQFRRFVVERAQCIHVSELIRVLVRVRRLWRLETPPAILELSNPQTKPKP